MGSSMDGSKYQDSEASHEGSVVGATVCVSRRRGRRQPVQLQSLKDASICFNKLQSKKRKESSKRTWKLLMRQAMGNTAQH